VFYIDVVKVDRNVANLTMVFQVYVPNVSFVFRCMLQVSYLDVVYTCMSQSYASSVSYVFQVFYLNVAYVLQ
jgi:hypothetical protein